MVHVIIIFCMLLICIILFATYRSAAGIRKNQRMNTTLPYEFLMHPEVTAIIDKFKKVNLNFFIISAIGTLPTFYITYTSLSLLYLALWMGLYFVIGNRLYCRYNNELILLKSKKNWFPEPYMYHELDGSCQIKRRKLLKKIYPSPMDRLLAKADGPIYVDEDEHWINGYYYNPGDRRSTVEKRMGVGTTANLATKGGIFSIYGAIVFITIVFGWMIILFSSMDFSTFKMKIGDTKVDIDAPMYDYDFMLSEIMEIRLTDTLPKHGTRTNGAATSAYYLGNFRFASYGSSKMYVYKDYPPYIVIKLTDKTVFFNTKSSEETTHYYDQLIEKKMAFDKGLTDGDIQKKEPEIQAVLSIKKLSDDDFQYVGTSNASKEDFRKVNFLLEVKHSSEMTDRAITVPMFHEVMNSYDTERYWYGDSTKSDNLGEDSVYSNDIMFYSGGLDQEGMAAVFHDAKISITWTDKKGSWKEEIIRIEDIIKFE